MMEVLKIVFDDQSKEKNCISAKSVVDLAFGQFQKAPNSSTEQQDWKKFVRLLIKYRIQLCVIIVGLSRTMGTMLASIRNTNCRNDSKCERKICFWKRQRF